MKKPEACGLLAEHIDFLDGNDYRGKDHLTPFADSQATIPELGQAVNAIRGSSDWHPGAARVNVRSSTRSR